MIHLATDQEAPEPAAWRFEERHANAEVRTASDGRLLAVVQAGPEQQRILRALKFAASVDKAACESCGGTGVDGDVDDYGRTIDIPCGECSGSGKTGDALSQPAFVQPSHEEMGALIFKLECFIDHATGGKLSKSSWALETLKAAADEHLSARVDEALHEAAPVQQEAALEGCTPADAQVLRAANPRFAETEQRLREALRFYAAQHHFGLSDPDAWDTVSGEGTNFWCDNAGTATVEDGWVAAAALRGEAADWGDDGPPPVCAGEPEDAIAALTPPAVAAPAVPPEGMHAKPCLVKCPITGLPYFMTIEHPELGMVETFGGPFDSYTVPALEGEPTEPWHEREMRCERYDHDAGGWVEGGHPVSLRIILEDTLFALQEQEDAPSEAVPYGWQLVPVEPTDAMLDAAASASMQHLIDCINDPDPKRQANVGSEAMVRKTHASRYSTMIAAAPSAAPAQAGETGEAS